MTLLLEILMRNGKAGSVAMVTWEAADPVELQNVCNAEHSPGSWGQNIAPSARHCL